MKYISFLGLLLVAVCAEAYQVGPQNRANFDTAKPTEQAHAQPSNQHRAFSNYNNRNWSKGVQTQAVQTEVAGTSAVDFDKNTPQKLVGKVQSAQPAAKPAKPQSAQAPSAGQQPAATPQAAAGMPANVDPAAMMQQVQGMVNAMGSNGQAPAGMPDISALMGGAMPTVPAAGQTPATPAKK